MKNVKYLILIFCLVSIFCLNNFVWAENDNDENDSMLKTGKEVYDIKFTLLKSYEDSVSMGNGALVEEGNMIVDEGKFYARIKFLPLEKDSFTGYLGDMIVEGEPANILETYDIYDEYNAPENGKDEKMKGISYPKLLEFPIFPNKDIYDCTVYIPVMGALGHGDQEARIKIEYPEEFIKKYGENNALNNEEIDNAVMNNKEVKNIEEKNKGVKYKEVAEKFETQNHSNIRSIKNLLYFAFIISTLSIGIFFSFKYYKKFMAEFAFYQDLINDMDRKNKEVKQNDIQKAQ